MSKFKVITGESVPLFNVRNSEIEALEAQINLKTRPTDRDLVVYAYHFLRLEHPVKAQKYLNKLDPNYFDYQIYKDLSKSLLLWSMAQTDAYLKQRIPPSEYEYFIILKRIVDTFEPLQFYAKPAFYRFRNQFREFTKL